MIPLNEEQLNSIVNMFGSEEVKKHLKEKGLLKESFEVGETKAIERLESCNRELITEKINELVDRINSLKK